MSGAELPTVCAGCTLDGLYGHIYDLARDELAYILDTFLIVRRKDEDRYGEYRTKRMVLEAYDRLADQF